MTAKKATARIKYSCNLTHIVILKTKVVTTATTALKGPLVVQGDPGDHYGAEQRQFRGTKRENEVLDN